MTSNDTMLAVTIAIACLDCAWTFFMYSSFNLTVHLCCELPKGEGGGETKYVEAVMEKCLEEIIPGSFMVH